MRHRQVTVREWSLHVVAAGNPAGRPFLFLHGWPESWRAWEQVMVRAAQHEYAVAVDLPGVGQSVPATDGSKRQLAEVVHELIHALGLRQTVLVGHDIGGMVGYAAVRAHQDIARAVIMDVVVPGVDPWDAVLHSPDIWHFGLHAVPGLPERLVQGRQKEYFDFFYDVLAADPAKITPQARSAYVRAYSTDSALTAGFNWYRAFRQDAVDHRRSSGQPVTTPVLYLRGEHERGDIRTYAAGLRAAGVTNLEYGLVADAGHFAPEEAPDQTWRRIAAFADLPTAAADAESP